MVLQRHCKSLDQVQDRLLLQKLDETGEQKDAVQRMAHASDGQFLCSLHGNTIDLLRLALLDMQPDDLAEYSGMLENLRPDLLCVNAGSS
jgi:hypothetical protein